MLDWFRARNANRRKAKELYGAVVAAARHPYLFSRHGVADTAEGRYEMIVLHLFLVLERLRAEGPPADDLTRGTLEALFTDMDDNLREFGVGDLSVPKRVKKAAAGFYERAEAYRAALAQPGDAAMSDAIARFVGSADHAALAAHARSQQQAFAAASFETVIEGRAFIAPPGDRP